MEPNVVNKQLLQLLLRVYLISTEDHNPVTSNGLRVTAECVVREKRKAQ